MNNTYDYFKVIRDYRDGIIELQNQYNEKIAEAKEAEGSAMGERLKAEAERKFAEDSESIRRQQQTKLKEIIARMRENAKKEKPPVPSSELLEKLQFLQMRDKGSITQQEIREIAGKCADVPDAYKVVADIARNLNIPIPPMTRQIIGEKALKPIEDLEKNGYLILSMPKINNRSEWWELGFAKMYTTKEDFTQGRAADYYRLDKPVQNEDEALTLCSSLATVDIKTQFKEIVND